MQICMNKPSLFFFTFYIGRNRFEFYPDLGEGHKQRETEVLPSEARARTCFPALDAFCVPPNCWGQELWPPGSQFCAEAAERKVEVCSATVHFPVHPLCHFPPGKYVHINEPPAAIWCVTCCTHLILMMLWCMSLAYVTARKPVTPNLSPPNYEPFQFVKLPPFTIMVPPVEL